jgi:phosphoribosylformylglycinamidine (FGAM) synthase PurS component
MAAGSCFRGTVITHVSSGEVVEFEVKTTLETGGEDERLHSKRVEKMCEKLHSKREEKM